MTIRNTILFLLIACPLIGHSAISPLTLLGDHSSPVLERLEDLWPEQVVRIDHSLTTHEMQRLSSASWETFINDTLAIAPKNLLGEALAPVTNPRTFTIPPTLLETGRRMREIRAIVRLRPEFTLEAYEFFSQCTENRELISTVTTVCLGHLVDLAHHHNLPINLERYPREMLEIASLTVRP
jgi:hypothetical protein